MKFSILREEFLKALRKVSGVVDAKSAQHLPILSNILLNVSKDKVVLTTTDEGLLLVCSTDKANVTKEGATTVSFRKLSDICKTLPNNCEINLSLVKDEKVKSEKVLLTAGRSKFLLATLPPEQFPVVEPKKGVLSVKVSKEKLRTVIDKTAISMAEQDVRYFLNGMLLEVRDSKIFVVAADGHRLSMNFFPIEISKDKSIRVIVPRKGVQEMLRVLDGDSPEVEISFSLNHITVTSDNLTLTTKLLDGKFPDYQRVIPKGGDKVVYGSREQLKEVFLRASSLFSEKQRGIRLSLTQGSLKILANNAENDEVEEDLDVDYCGPDLDICFNVRYLIDYLSVFKSEIIQLTLINSSSSVLLEAKDDAEKNGVYVLMPMRI